jgi:prepilin-type N-terminal cleavage/methylation domain-containing protein
MKKIKLTKGFTLIELLVVIAIIGILGAIVYAPFQTARRKGRDAQKIVEMKNIQAGLFLYSDSHGGYFPTSLTELENSQTERLPVNANKTGIWDPNKYNYVAYASGGNIIGFHLITHLETNSPVLSGTAACRGYYSVVGVPVPVGMYPCIIAPNVSYSLSGLGAVTEPDVSSAKLTPTERSNDNDTNCATDRTSCIYDLKS